MVVLFYVNKIYIYSTWYEYILFHLLFSRGSVFFTTISYIFPEEAGHVISIPVNQPYTPPQVTKVVYLSIT